MVYSFLRVFTKMGGNKVGRPSGRIKTAKIEISIEPSVKNAFMNILHSEGKSASVQVGEWIKGYISSAKKSEAEK